MDRLVLLKHLKQGPELARLIDEASRDTIHKRARPWMFISGREVDFTERANVARIVVVALLELPRQVDIGNCWLIADKLTVHDRAPADLLGQLREMLRQGVIRLGDRNGQPDFAVPPNVPVASSRVLKSELTIDVGDLDAGISHAALKLAFDTMFGPNMNLEKRKQMLSEAATIVGGKAQRHTAMVYEWVDALCSLLPEADPQYFKVASRHEERPLGFAPPDPNLDRLRTELDNFGAPEARVRMAFQSLQTSPLLKAWELAYGSAASSHLAARGWARIVRAIIDDPPQLPPSQGRHELLLALKPAFMQAARYEFRNSDFHPKGGSAFSRLFIRTANVPDGVEVKTPRIFEQALYVLVKEMPVPANADPKFEDCRQALMRILNDPSSGFAARTVGSSVNDEPGSSPWQLGEASWGGGVWDVSGANSAAWDLRKPTRTFTHEQPWYRVIRGTDPHSIDLLTANGRYASQTKIRSSDQYASRDTLEHLIVAMRAVDEADPKGLQTSIDAHGTLLIAMAGHFFRLLPQNFIDAWQGDGTKLSASDWIELQVEKPGQAFRQKQCPADEAREKVSAVLQRMDLTPEAQERIRQAVSNKADLKAGSNGEPLFTFGKLIDALASEFKEPPRTRELLCWAVMQTFDPLGELCVPVADTNWDARDSFRPVEGSLLCAYAYNLVEQQVSQWGAVQASHPDNPDASCLQYSVYLKELR